MNNSQNQNLIVSDLIDHAVFMYEKFSNSILSKLGYYSPTLRKSH